MLFMGAEKSWGTFSKSICVQNFHISFDCAAYLKMRRRILEKRRMVALVRLTEGIC